MSRASELLERDPRVFWGKAIRMLIERGWNPPPPDERIVDELLRDMEHVDDRPGIELDVDAAYDLTRGERRVAQLLALGLETHEIADELGLSRATVKFHLTAIFRKLGATNRTQAALMLADALERPAA